MGKSPTPPSEGRKPRMSDERLKIWLDLPKIFVGTTVVGIVVAFINSEIQSRQIEVKRIDSYNTHLSKFTKIVTDKDLDKRLDLAIYFSLLSLVKNDRKKWEVYTTYIRKQIDRSKEDINPKKSEIRNIDNQIKQNNSYLKTFTDNPKAIIFLLSDNKELRIQRSKLKLRILSYEKAKEIADTYFLVVTAVRRVEAIIRNVLELPDDKAIALSRNLPTNDPISEKLVAKLDPQNKRFTDAKIARRTLSARIRTDKRTKNNLSKWEAALGLHFADDVNTKLLEAFLKLDPKTKKRDPVNEGLLIAWMTKNGLQNPKRNITVLLFSKAMAGARQRAVKDLKLTQ